MQEQELIFHSYANGNHQCTSVLLSQESGINTNYRSIMCEASHTLQEAPEYVLQHWIISIFFIWKPLLTSIDGTSGAWVEV
jgi:hypothetical protein